MITTARTTAGCRPAPARWRPAAVIAVLLAVNGALRVGTASAASLSDTVATVKRSVVGIGTRQDLRRPPVLFRGTGFAVGDGTVVLTNAHVIPRRLAIDERESLVVMVPAGRTQVEARPARVIASDRVHDLALIKIQGTALPALTIGDSSKVREGEPVAFTGFPIGVVLGLTPVTHRGIVSAITPIAIPQVSAAHLTREMLARLGNPFDVFQLDATAYPGNSGSPLYDPATGRVVGIVNMVFVKETKENVLERPSGITYAIPGRFIRALLRRAGR